MDFSEIFQNDRSLTGPIYIPLFLSVFKLNLRNPFILPFNFIRFFSNLVSSFAGVRRLGGTRSVGVYFWRGMPKIHPIGPRNAIAVKFKLITTSYQEPFVHLVGLSATKLIWSDNGFLLDHQFYHPHFKSELNFPGASLLGLPIRSRAYLSSTPPFSMFIRHSLTGVVYFSGVLVCVYQSTSASLSQEFSAL